MVNITIKPYHSLPCGLMLFKINGMNANKEDFGNSEDDRSYIDFDKYDLDTINYGCCNMRFIPDEKLKDSAMKKYGLSEEDYEAVIDELECKLCVGKCDWCV